MVAGRRRQPEGRQDREIGGGIVHRRGDGRQQGPEVGFGERHLDVFGADRRGDGACRRPLVVNGRLGKADGERQHRRCGLARHGGEHRRGIDAAGQKQSIRHVGPAMQAHAFGKNGIQVSQGIRFRAVDGAAARQGAAAQAVDDTAVLDDDRLARQDTIDPGERGRPPGGELQLQQLIAQRPADPRRDEAGGDQRLRLRGEGEAHDGLGVVERLDAERIAAQHQASGGTAVAAPVVQGDGIHAAEPFGEAKIVVQIEVQRCFTIRAGGVARRAQSLAHLGIVVDLAIGDQRHRGIFVVGDVGRMVFGAGEQRLIAGLQVDDGEAGVNHADAAGDVLAAAVRPAMGQRFGQPPEDRGVRRPAATHHHAGDSTHRPPPRHTRSGAYHRRRQKNKRCRARLPTARRCPTSCR